LMPTLGLTARNRGLVLRQGRQGWAFRTVLPALVGPRSGWLPPVYRLTDDGHDLATAMTPLIAWGLRRIGDRKPEDTVRPRWSAVGMAALADRGAAKGVSETYQYLIGDAAFHFMVDEGSIELHDGRAEDAAVVLSTDDETWVDLATGKTTFSSATASGALTVSGDPAAVKRMRKIFSRRQMLAHADPKG
jgi:putative sterol carrier protein